MAAVTLASGQRLKTAKTSFLSLQTPHTVQGITTDPTTVLPTRDKMTLNWRMRSTCAARPTFSVKCALTSAEAAGPPTARPPVPSPPAPTGRALAKPPSSPWGAGSSCLSPGGRPPLLPACGIAPAITSSLGTGALHPLLTTKPPPTAPGPFPCPPPRDCDYT